MTSQKIIPADHPEISLTIDWNRAASAGSVLRMKKSEIFPVRLARAGEVMQSGDIAGEDNVAVFNSEQEQDIPLYCMPMRQFLNVSHPVGHNGDLEENRYTCWNVECLPRDVYFLPEPFAPVYLDIPMAWRARGASGQERRPWYLDSSCNVVVRNGHDQELARGIPLVRTEEGIIYDRHGWDNSLYIPVPA